jgi:hypothetical protein
MALGGLLQIRESVIASADISAHQNKLVKITATGLALCEAGERGFPLVEAVDAATKKGTIVCVGKEKVIAGAAVVAGVAVTADAAGLAVTAVATDELCGIALEAAADGDLFKILVLPGATI